MPVPVMDRQSGTLPGDGAKKLCRQDSASRSQRGDYTHHWLVSG